MKQEDDMTLQNDPNVSPSYSNDILTTNNEDFRETMIHMPWKFDSEKVNSSSLDNTPILFWYFTKCSMQKQCLRGNGMLETVIDQQKMFKLEKTNF